LRIGKLLGKKNKRGEKGWKKKGQRPAGAMGEKEIILTAGSLKRLLLGSVRKGEKRAHQLSREPRQVLVSGIFKVSGKGNTQMENSGILSQREPHV